MPVIRLHYGYLEKMTGADRETILASLPMLGSDIERVEEDHVDVEFFPCRPDLFSVEGVARAMRGFLGLETGLPRYSVTPSGVGFSVDPGLAAIRPFLGSAVIRNVDLDEESILSLMGLQEALHWAVGRGRSKVAIGIHDFDAVTPPFRYIAAEKSRSFVPLDFDREMTLDGILDEHPKGKAYAHIVRDFPRYPLIVDARDRVLSFPPIINGELTRVTPRTRNLLLDTTGTDERAVATAVDIICTALADTGARVHSVTIGGKEVPTLSPSERVVSSVDASALLGVSLDPVALSSLLEKMRYGAEPAGQSNVRVLVPCYRADIMHDWDVFEDAAIAYGYGNFDAEMPQSFAIGRPPRDGDLRRRAGGPVRARVPGGAPLHPHERAGSGIEDAEAPERLGRPGAAPHLRGADHGPDRPAPAPPRDVPAQQAPRTPPEALCRGRRRRGDEHAPEGCLRQHPRICRFLRGLRRCGCTLPGTRSCSLGGGIGRPGVHPRAQGCPG